MEKKHLDFTIDFETCALTANAAPMQVAVVPWLRDAEKGPFMNPNDAEPLVQYVDLRTCVVEGMDFDQKTIDWWRQRDEKAKHSVCEGLGEPVADVLVNVLNYIRDLVKQHQLESICLWCQGEDVDIAILRSLCSRFDIDLEETVPHASFRDCRTVILEAALIEAERSMKGKSTCANGIALPHQIQKDPSLAYKIFPPLPSFYAEGVQHDALYDALRSTWLTYHALKILRV